MEIAEIQPQINDLRVIQYNHANCGHRDDIRLDDAAENTFSDIELRVEKVDGWQPVFSSTLGKTLSTA